MGINFKEIIKREFGGMTERAKRDDALGRAKWLLDEWRDYGDKTKLTEAIRILVEESD